MNQTTTDFQIDQYLAVVQKNRDCLKALAEHPVDDQEANAQLKERYETEMSKAMQYANERAKRFGCFISWENNSEHAMKFLFAYQNPLDSVEVTFIKGVEIIDEFCHFQIIPPAGDPYLKKAPKSKFVMDQIAQHGIHILANL